MHLKLAIKRRERCQLHDYGVVIAKTLIAFSASEFYFYF